MASKTIVVVLGAVVVAAASVFGAAEAKLGKVGEELGKLGKVGRLVISGVVPCNTGSLIDIATSPAFPSKNTY
jgi:hypothetical protein